MIDRKTMLNATLADLRGRVDTLAKAVFLIAGGSVTLSVNAYLNNKEILCNVVCYLKQSWFLLLISILLFAVVIGLLILQGFISSEFYREKIEKDEEIVNHPKRCIDYIACVAGVFGFVLFFIGMVDLILAALYM